jgi:hypothetical protein
MVSAATPAAEDAGTNPSPLNFQIPPRCVAMRI